MSPPLPDATKPTSVGDRVHDPAAIAPLPMVSIVIVAHAASNVITDCLESLRRQDYPTERREFVLVHSDANDGTREAMEAWKNGQAAGERVLILPNPKRLLAPGWNVALAALSGDVVIRLDAHARADEGFLRRNVEVMNRTGESVVGGRAPVEEPDGYEAYLCWLVSKSIFGAGQAAYRRQIPAGYVDTLAYAAFHRRVFEVVGGYDERLGRTEDNEMHHRMQEAGFKFYYDPSISSRQLARPTIRTMLRQKYQNGYWVAVTMPVAPRCFSMRHFIPAVFTVALGVSVVALVFGIHWPMYLVGGSYAVAAAIAALYEGYASGRPVAWFSIPLLPVLFLMLHLSNGLGLIRGLLDIPRRLRQWRGYRVPRPMVPRDRT